MMGMIFISQFCENVMKVATGKDGYFISILGLFARKENRRWRGSRYTRDTKGNTKYLITSMIRR